MLARPGRPPWSDMAGALCPALERASSQGPIHRLSSSPTRTLPPAHAGWLAMLIWLLPAPSTDQR